MLGEKLMQRRKLEHILCKELIKKELIFYELETTKIFFNLSKITAF